MTEVEARESAPKGEALPMHISEVHRLRIERFEAKRKMICDEFEALTRDYLAFMADLGKQYQFDGAGNDEVNYATGQIVRKG